MCEGSLGCCGAPGKKDATPHRTLASLWWLLSSSAYFQALLCEIAVIWAVDRNGRLRLSGRRGMMSQGRGA